MSEITKTVPTIAIIGLPNSGKSTLLNRLGSTRKAVTANEEGTTRDLNWSDEIWNGMYVSMVDTGGLLPKPEDKIAKLVQIKTYSAISKADLLVWVIDRRTRVETISIEMMQRIWKSGKPTIIVINKVDNPNTEKDISDYAQLGGIDFVNVSASNGYNLGILMDSIVDNLEKIGFKKGNFEDIAPEIMEKPAKKSRKNLRNKIVKQNSDGTYYVVREDDENGAPGLFKSITADEVDGFEKYKRNEITSLVFDFWGVIFFNDVERLAQEIVEKQKLGSDMIEVIEGKIQDLLFEQNYKDKEFVKNWESELSELTNGYQIDAAVWAEYFYAEEEMVNWIKELAESGKYKLYYLTNNSQVIFNEQRKHEVFDYFDGGIASFETDICKPDLEIYRNLINRFDIEPNKAIFIDDQEKNIIAAKKVGFWGIEYKDGLTDLTAEINKIEMGDVQRIKTIPKILFLGKPNVGKSTLFNSMVGEEIQIVTDIAGTTLSVNDMLVERKVKIKDKE
jgi:HAD superfamily hydrolase (TIGR01509 family)